MNQNITLIELTRTIEEAKTSYELAKTEEEAIFYKAILNDLRTEKRELLDKEFNRK